LSRSGDVAVSRQMIEKGSHVLGAETAGVCGVVKANEPDDPAYIGALGMQAILAPPACAADAINQFGGLVGPVCAHGQEESGENRGFDKLRSVFYYVKWLSIVHTDVLKAIVLKRDRRNYQRVLCFAS